MQESSERLEYLSARERLRQRIFQETSLAGLHQAEVSIDDGILDLSQGPHHALIKTPYGAQSMALQHSWFIDIDLLRWQGIQLIRERIDKLKALEPDENPR